MIDNCGVTCVKCTFDSCVVSRQMYKNTRLN